jgi:hypothetical protein
MPGRRLLVALLLVPLPACLHVGAPTPPAADEPKGPPRPAAAKAEPAAPRLEFASLPRLPRVPGTVVLANPAPGPKPPAVAFDSPPVNSVQPAFAESPPGPVPIAPASIGPAPESPLLAAVRADAEGRPDRAIDALRPLDKANQDVVLALLPVLAHGATADLNNPVTVAALVDQLRSVATRLEPRAALRVENVSFCSDVDGFGRFVPRPAATPFRPNERINVYLEVRNVTSEPTGDGYLTTVSATVEIRDAKKRLVEQIDPDEPRRRVPVVRFEKKRPSRSPLHDFHVLYSFSAPPAPGVYEITVELHDPTGNRVVRTAPVEFSVAGP